MSSEKVPHLLSVPLIKHHLHQNSQSPDWRTRYRGSNQVGTPVGMKKEAGKKRTLAWEKLELGAVSWAGLLHKDEDWSSRSSCRLEALPKAEQHYDKIWEAQRQTLGDCSTKDFPSAVLVPPQTLGGQIRPLTFSVWKDRGRHRTLDELPDRWSLCGLWDENRVIHSPLISDF